MLKKSGVIFLEILFLRKDDQLGSNRHEIYKEDTYNIYNIHNIHIYIYMKLKKNKVRFLLLNIIESDFFFLFVDNLGEIVAATLIGES